MPSGEYCTNCGEPPSGRHSLPVDDNGAVVGNAHVFVEGPLTGIPCCENCYNVHAACGNASNDIVRAVLKAYARATESLGVQLEHARDAFGDIRRSVDAAFGEIGEPSAVFTRKHT